MTRRRNPLTSFLRDEAGAVTVEYVVLAAAITGVALGSADIINRGLAVLAGTIDSELAEDVSAGTGALVYSDGFDNGSAGWNGATVADIRGVGKVLGPIGGSGGAQAITREFQIDPNAASATFSFDLLALDSLDNESGIVYINGREVGRVTSNGGNTSFTPATGLAAGMTITGTIVDNQVQLGGLRPDSAGYSMDSRTRIQISMTEPSDKVTFGFGSTANQGVDDESFAIDNFNATGLADPDAAQV